MLELVTKSCVALVLFVSPSHPVPKYLLVLHENESDDDCK